MLKFHHMWRGKPLSSNELRELSILLEKIGYESVLLTFHSESPDYLIKSAAALIQGNKLKYMIALRPYHMSAQYCAMVTEGFNQIESGRLIFNWIAGDSHNRTDEGEQKDFAGNTENINSIEKKKEFLRNFVLEYDKMPVISAKPEMVFSGYSEYTIDTAGLLNGTTLCMIDDYRNNKELFKNIKNKMVCVNPIILNSSEDINKYKELLVSLGSRLLPIAIIGTKEEVKNKLLELENEGITDIMINTHRPEFGGMWNELSDINDVLVNELIMEIYKERAVYYEYND